ncbi:MAG: D-alanyl-D-alanine carboxypeptidase [Clostridia bacterium]|jgi:hypothetical protein|nr:D-alanyl-D-alanine carboxypeptidase [Clostridia bacterium]
MKKVILIGMLLVCILLLTMCEQASDNILEKPIEMEQAVDKGTEQPKQEQAVDHTTGQLKQDTLEVKEPAVQEVFAQSFEYYSIDKEVEKRIVGISWKQNNTIKLEDLCYLKVTYWGFDEKPHIGELIVNKDIGHEVIEIFQELYEAKFPIEKMKLIDEYDGIDSKSMADNNTSAFCYREVDGKPGKLSKHSYGIAIDINPVQNPYVYQEKIAPEKGIEYIDRSKTSKGMITANDVCYKAFTNRGWTWGGDWKYEKDYQHFQK